MRIEALKQTLDRGIDKLNLGYILHIIAFDQVKHLAEPAGCFKLVEIFPGGLFFDSSSWRGSSLCAAAAQYKQKQKKAGVNKYTHLAQLRYFGAKQKAVSPGFNLIGINLYAINERTSRWDQCRK